MNRLTPDQLKEIALAEGIEIAKRARKPTIVKNLLGISVKKIREYVHDYTRRSRGLPSSRRRLEGARGERRGKIKQVFP